MSEHLHFEIDCFLWVLVFVFGLSLGSFYACVVQRFLLQRPIFSSRSRCEHCQKIILTRDLIPLVSYFLLRGKSRCCQKTIDKLYWQTEFLTALCYCFLFSSFGLSGEFLFYCAIFGVLLILSMIDIKIFILPDIFIALGVFILIPIGIFFQYLDWFSALFGGGLAFGLVFVLRLYFCYVRKIDALGFGDIKLLFFLGLIVGVEQVPVLLFIASSLGILWIALQYLITKQSQWAIAIAFGPFLNIACFIVVLTITSI